MSRILGTRPVAPARPACQHCGRRLRPDFVTEQRRVPHPDGAKGYDTRTAYTGRIRGYGYRSQGIFCSLSHGYEYGLRIARAVLAEGGKAR